VSGLTSREIDELIAANEAGESTYALAQGFGIRRETVTGQLKRHGIMRRSNPRFDLDAETRPIIIELGMWCTGKCRCEEARPD